MKKRRKLKPVIVTLVGIFVIGYLIYSGIRDTMTYYLTVSEVLAKAPDLQNEAIRVGGNVTPASVQWDPKTLKLLFNIKDERSSLFVNYNGVVPDSFKPGSEVIIEGIYNKNKRIFHATSIMPKCGSKYE